MRKLVTAAFFVTLFVCFDVHGQCALAPAVLFDPPNNSTIGYGTVALRWAEVSGAAGYEPFVSIDNGPPESLGLTARTSITFVVGPGRNVKWAVKAKAPNCAESASSFFVFNTDCPTERPQLVSPARGAHVAELQPVHFSWNGIIWAESYDVVVTPDFGETFTTIADDITDTSFSTVLANGDWGWFVRANIDGNCPPLNSEPSSFSVGAACNNAAPKLSSPADGAKLKAPITFTWEAAAGATAYNVFALEGATRKLIGRTTTTSLTLNSAAAGTFAWFVAAEFPDCPSVESEHRTITIEADGTCSGAQPVPHSPADNATGVTSPVTFTWSAAANAIKYALFLSHDGGEFSFAGETAQTSLQTFVAPGTIRWFVVAFFTACPQARSTVATFTAVRGDADCPTGTITLRSPSPSAIVSSPVTLSWSPINGVQAYRVTISDAHGSISRRTTSTVETIELPAGAMRWYVEGLREDCPPIVSAEGAFTVQRATNCDANRAPSLLSPVGSEANPTVVTSPVTLSWNAAANVLGYRIWISRNGNAYEDVGVTTATLLTLTLPPGKYGWYLEALFRGCDPVASSKGFFLINATTARCSDAAPTPLAPAQGATVSGSVEFRWTAVPNAARYRLFVSLNGSEERLLGATEATSLTRLLPPGAATWRVEAVFDECPSTSSARVAFTIPQAANCIYDAPDLVTPANGETRTDNEVTFTWTPISSALRYVVVAKTKDGSPVPIGDTTDTTLTRKMPFGEIEWRVIAFFAGCNPQDSGPARFTITPNQNCPNRAPVLLLPGERTRAVYSPVVFAWTRVPGATGYNIWVPQGSPVMVATTTETTADVDLPPGTYTWFVEAKFANCPSTESARAEFTVSAPVACTTPEQPEPQVVGRAISGTPYRLRWTPLPNVALYEVQESTTADFANAQTFVTAVPVIRFQHDVTATTQYLYRVRGISKCNETKGAYSDPIGVFVIPQRTNNSSAELGLEGVVVQKVVLPGSATPLPFVAKLDKPWLTVTPSSGTVGTDPVTLTVTADPAFLFLGTNTGTVTVTYTTPSAKNLVTNGVTTANVPVSVSLVTPVTPGGKGTPPPESLIFPIVGHAAGVNDSLFESDIRVANLTPNTMKYQVNFTPSGTDGTQTGSSTTIEIAPNTTTALDDIVSTLFGAGTTTSALGMLEVRPLTTSTTTSPTLFTTVASTFPPLATAASSRTYNFTPTGTFGQFIPAIPFAKFAGKGAILSLLQVSQSVNYRANFGFAEASGSPVDLMLRVYDTKSNLLATIPVSLGPSEHKQINSMLSVNGINDLADGRVDVEVLSGNGKVTAYVSEIDNKTNDPLLVNAVPKGATSANRYVVPGMAYINNGFAFWVSDLRIFNAGATTNATLTFYPQNNGAPVSKQVTVDAGEIEVLDNVVANFFGQPNGAGGAIVITTAANTQLSATARTYNQTPNGTYGQFIPAVTVAESVGAADRALQILQLETSSRIRTNVGVSETTGNPVTVEITAIQPDSIVTPVITMNLAANEFVQLPLANFFDAGAAVYNARVTVKVISGTGRVTAYGSAIDVITQDPTYVQAQ